MTEFVENREHSLDEGRPRWSVVIPVHNCADYLASALPEVVAQLADWDQAEIIVVDDASDDDPSVVVQQLGKGKVRYVANPHNLGAVRTFNRCIELATGDLVHLLHGDDGVYPGFYSAMDKAMSDPETVAATCRTCYVDANGRPGHTTKSYRNGTGVWTNALEAQAVSNRIRPPGIVVRRHAYERIGGFRTDLPHAADWDMWVRLAATGPIVFIDEVLAYYRRHDASDTAERVRSGANIRERVTAIGVVSQYIPAERRGRTTRLALAFSAVFATRTAASLIRHGNWRAATRQLWEAARCLAITPRGVQATTADVPPPIRRPG